jgi:hypothetical protein
LADEVFPRVRAEVARRLVAEGWSQTRAAQALGISQAMVSKYVAARPERADPLVARLGDELHAELTSNVKTTGPSSWCATLTVGQDHPGGEEALADLLEAERMLRQASPLALMPQIGLNLARALPHSKGPDEVLSFPGRLVDAGGRLVTPAPPAFGASGHLARCLLHLRVRDPEALALASVRGGPAVAKALRALHWHATEAGGARRDPEAAVRHAIDQARDPRTIHDPGAVGIEPCLYLAGPDARSVAGRILRLEQALQVNP